MRQAIMAAVAAVAAVAVVACTASAQISDTLSNGGFELEWQDAGRPPNVRPGNIFGFTNNNDPDASVSTAFAHGGARSMSLGNVDATGFLGYTTDTLDSMPPNFTFLFYDVPLSWQSGDLVWSYWYLIPAGASLGTPPTPNWPVDANPGTDFVWPEGFAPASLKIDVKGAGSGNQNNATYDGWSYAFSRDIRGRQSLQWGTTDGLWQQVTVTWPARTPDRQGWKDQTEDNQTVGNYTLPPEGTWPNPPAGQARFPDRAKLTFGRFNPSSTAAGGRIYIDDFSFVQTPAGPQPCGTADIGRSGGQPGADGALDNNDFIVFITYFFQQNTIADMGIAGGVIGQDGQFDNNDFIAFITLFFQGCNG
ncbi:MAG: hypothetical protein K2Q09_05160 [Phycisphaerales bacterium]|nr:hypothetical protein [Phycisphaerales bacterium]